MFLKHFIGPRKRHATNVAQSRTIVWPSHVCMKNKCERFDELAVALILITVAKHFNLHGCVVADKWLYVVARQQNELRVPFNLLWGAVWVALQRYLLLNKATQMHKHLSEGRWHGGKKVWAIFSASVKKYYATQRT